MTVYRYRYTPTDPRLGRHVEHDSRSLQYLSPESDLSGLKSVRHVRFVPVFDQGQVGSCTGNAATGNVGTGLFWDTIDQKGFLSGDATADEKVAVSVYSDAEDLDGDGPYPPNDNGSSGLSVAKVLKTRGIISGYLHATTLNAVLTALSKQPVIVGTRWHNDMFNPDADGRLHPTGPVEGGHEYVLDELDMENQRVWMQNSWGVSWGLSGRAYITFDDLATLLAADGDCTVFTPLGTTPQPAPAPDSDKDKFVKAAQAWLDLARIRPANKKFAEAVRQYLASISTQ